jgi:hypothetical protein
MKTLLLIAAVCLLGGRSGLGQTVAEVIPSQTLKLQEWFGVSHPEQVVEFALDVPGTAGQGAVHDESGTPVPFQLLDQGRKLAIRTDLPANTTRAWRWYAADRNQTGCPSGVQTKQTEEGWEISNALIAFRVPNEKSIRANAQPAAQSSLRPLVDLFNQSHDAPRIQTLAPIQGVRWRDGSWTAQGSNTLSALARQLTGARVEIAESGPLEAVVRIRYDFDKPAYASGGQKISDAGPGYLTVTMTLFAGQPSVLFEEETDLEEAWAANFYEGLSPDHAQYCGHHSTAPEFGHESNGGIYKPKYQRGEPDAIVDLQYLHPQKSSYLSSNQTWRYMAVWDPWIFDSGWYWQLYNSAANDNSNLVSIFSGPASRAIGPGASGAGIFTLPADPRSSTPVAGIYSQSYRSSADAKIYPCSRFSWGLFLGTKRDLSIPKQVTTVNLQANLFGGVASLTKLAAMKFDFPDSERGYGGLYMDKAALDDVIGRVRQARQPRDSYYHWLYSAEPTSRPLLDAWADESGGKMHDAVNDITQVGHDLMDDLVHGRGIRSFRFGYWHGGLEMMRRGLWIDQVLASDKLSPEERARVKAVACLFSYVLWDNDFVPMDNSNGINLGTANMPQQQQGYRYFYATLLARHADFAERAKIVNENVLTQVRQQINESGAHFGCPHYMSAAFAPTLNTLMQLKQLGQTDPFRAEPRLAKFAEFYLNLLTPPEVRYPGKPRSYIALSDSSTEASPLYGQLGTAFRDADPTLSRRLMGAWQAGGKPHSGFFGSTVMSIDDQLPAEDPSLGSATFPGYYSVLRAGWGSPGETAAWIINGDFYRDHRHNDAGELILYALGVPLSVHWGSIYSPQTPGAYAHSTIVPETEIGRPWDQADPPLNAAADRFWVQSSQEKFTTSETMDSSISKFVGTDLEWTREVQLEHSDAALPVIVLTDRFNGPQAAEGKILTLNLMAQGAVQTPAGEITPELRTHPMAEKASDPVQLASASKVVPLDKGISRLSFTGQFGVDFDVFVVAPETQQALLGNWADSWTQQSIAKWEERQHILRIRGTSSFQLIIVPFRTGQRPTDLKIEPVEGGFVLTAKGKTHPLLQ